MQPKTKKLILSFLIILFIGLVMWYVFTLKNNNLVNYYNEQPSYKLLNKDCNWIRKEFPKSGISFYEKTCTNPNSDQRTYFEDENGKIMSTNPSVIGGKPYLVMEVLNKDPNQTPLEVMKQEWFSKLSSKQKKDCSIQDLVKFDYQEGIESPYRVTHKIRYEISPKPEVVKTITDRFDGLPSGSDYDYLCGNTVGSLFYTSAPYFEFDDRSPSKYIFVHLSWNDDGPNIDLNTISF